jgi:SAM-dependent methyltransferase
VTSAIDEMKRVEGQSIPASKLSAELYDFLLGWVRDRDSDAAAVHRWIGDGEGTVLDAGCGPGDLSHRLARLGHEVVGADNSESYIEAAKRNNPAPRRARFQKCDLTAPLPFATGSFRAVLAMFSVPDVLALQMPRHELLCELRRTIAVDGSLILDGVEASRHRLNYPDDIWRPFGEAAALGRPPRAGLRHILRASRHDGITVLEFKHILYAEGREWSMITLHPQRHATLPEHEQMLKDTGFRLDAALSGFDDRPALWKGRDFLILRCTAV